VIKYKNQEDELKSIRITPRRRDSSRTLSLRKCYECAVQKTRKKPCENWELIGETNGIKPRLMDMRHRGLNNCSPERL
jgi:hypothetical protein